MHATCDGIIPENITDDEIVVRTLFSPANVKSGNRLQHNFMDPPSGPDEDDETLVSNKLSVTRFLYAGMSFCREHGIVHSNPDKRRNYYGVAVFEARKLRECLYNGEPVDVLSKPMEDNPAHANVRLPFYNTFPAEPGRPRDPEQKRLCVQLCGLAKVFTDPMEDNNELRDLVDRDITNVPIKAKCQFD
jgi:hypothetical protein